MATVLCPWCGSPNPEGSQFCRRCGGKYPDRALPPPILGSYSPLRFQVDPGLAPPPRDVRWVFIALGLALVALAVFFLIAGGLLMQALSLGTCGQGAAPCAGLTVGQAFEEFGAAMLGIGVLCVVYGIIRALR
jgi:hypothetical protein